MEYVDEGLIPIIQVPDVVLNKVIKQSIKKKYHEYQINQPTLKPGEKKLSDYSVKGLTGWNERDGHQAKGRKSVGIS